ncbi:MAG: ABC transporter ATP-binding protein [Oscillospiraceae bacterium]|nr:ABC transporter ATP-binding protein [Oscillospiraceae bacterium]
MLKIDHVSMVFGGLTANNDVCAEVHKGEIFGLIGPNGAGKTTLFNVISGFYKPTAGKVIFNGEEIQGKLSNQIAQKGIARTYQNINLFKKMTVLENVLVGCHTQTRANIFDAIFNTKRSRAEHEEAIRRCREVLEFMGIGHLEDSLAGSLPYGDQRRLEIARALVSNPKLLLLDEPAAGMNLTEKDILTDTILKIRDLGYTVLIVEHNMKLVMKVCDRICVLNHGNKLAEGTPEEIQNNPDVIKAYLGGAK